MQYKTEVFVVYIKYIISSNIFLKAAKIGLIQYSKQYYKINLVSRKIYSDILSRCITLNLLFGTNKSYDIREKYLFLQCFITQYLQTIKIFGLGFKHCYRINLFNGRIYTLQE